MKRTVCFILSLALLPQLCACSVLGGARETEQLRVIQTMGVDYAPGGVLLTLAPASGRDEAAACLSAEGVSVSAAMEHLRDRSVQEEVFCGHIRNLLLGEEAARQGIGPLLEYLCRSSDLRLETPVFVLQGASANEVMSQAGDARRGIDQLLQAAEARLDYHSDSRYFTAAQISRNLDRFGGSLVCALDFREAAEADTRTAALSGFGILKDGKLLHFLDEDEAIGAGFLLGSMGVADVTVHDLEGRPVTLEITASGTDLRPLWAADGSLQGLEIRAEARASLLEGGGRGDESYIDYLTGQLETAASERIRAVLQLSRRLRADFLGLGGRIELASPAQYRALEQDLGVLLPKLEISISVKGSIIHSNDVK